MIISIAAGIIIALLVGTYILVKETPEQKSSRLAKEEVDKVNYLKLIEGVQVEITDGNYPAPDFIGRVTKKVVFNSWECDHSLVYFIVDVYKGEVKVATKTFYDTQLKAI